MSPEGSLQDSLDEAAHNPRDAQSQFGGTEKLLIKSRAQCQASEEGEAPPRRILEGQQGTLNLLEVPQGLKEDPHGALSGMAHKSNLATVEAETLEQIWLKETTAHGKHLRDSRAQER